MDSLMKRIYVEMLVGRPNADMAGVYLAMLIKRAKDERAAGVYITGLIRHEQVH
jgi:hypothetical protein